MSFGVGTNETVRYGVSVSSECPQSGVPFQLQFSNRPPQRKRGCSSHPSFWDLNFRMGTGQGANPERGYSLWYHLSIEGIRKGYLFREKWYIKEQGVGPRGGASPYKHLLSTPRGVLSGAMCCYLLDLFIKLNVFSQQLNSKNNSPVFLKIKTIFSH